MTPSGRPFDFDSEARADFVTGAVPAARRPPARPAAAADHRPHDEASHEGHEGFDAPDHHDDRSDQHAGYDDHADHDRYDDGRYDDDGDHGHEVDRYDHGRYDDDRYDDGYDELDDHEEPNRHEPEPRRNRRGQHHADSGELLKRVVDIVASARSLPLSASVSINRDEVLELLEEALDRLPDELREARWLRKEREDYLEKMRSDGDEIIAHARTRVEHMVQRTEIMKAAEHRARRIVEEAEAAARRLRLETEDYCDHRLARFEIILERTLKNVMDGRARLQETGARFPSEDPRELP